MTQTSGVRAPSMLSPVIKPKKDDLIARLQHPIRRGKNKANPTASASANQTLVNQSLVNSTLVN